MESSTLGPRLTKIAQLQAILRAPDGASLAQLCAATGWQAHTVRAALTRLRQAGHAAERSRSEAGATVYRIRGDEVSKPGKADAGAGVARGRGGPQTTSAATGEDIGGEVTSNSGAERGEAPQDTSEAPAGTAEQAPADVASA